jgi:hypothetical protein
MKKYESLKKVIQDVVPGIKELKFGCYVIPYNEKPEPVLSYRPSGYEQGGIQTLNYSGLYEKDVKILGREIRLADVLVAMALRTKYEKTVLMMDVPGTISYSDAEHSLIMKWALLDDNLDHQSNECKQFLINLLVKE